MNKKILRLIEVKELAKKVWKHSENERERERETLSSVWQLLDPQERLKKL